jgi:hypothetical protein
MKWNILIGSLVLAVCVSTQSYGFELLDRMLGLKGCGCEAKSCETKADTKCGAEKAKDKCGADKADKNGCDAKKKSRRSLLGHGCDAKDKCGAEKAKCGAEKAKCGADKDGKKEAGEPKNSQNFGDKKGKPVRVANTNKCGSEKAACQAKKKADKDGCDAKTKCRGSLLDHILSLGHGCDDKACDGKKADDKCGAERKKRCGCDAAGKKAESSAEVTPATPPAPVVDPSALLPSQRRVVHASLNTIR